MHKAAIIFIIALFYALTAQLGFSIATPHTMIAPIWPPAGIAFAAVLIFGNIALVGIFIGSACANAHLFLDTALSFYSLFLLVPAIGSVIQAYVGKLALIRLTGSSNIFQNTRTVLIFILVSAFGACLINTTLSTSLLALIGNLPLRDLPYQWVTWWIADAVGVVAISSIIIAFTEYWGIKISVNQLGKLVLTWFLILLIGYYTIQSNLELNYVYIPFAIWAAFQFDIRLSLLTGLLISAICLYGSAHTNYYLMHGPSDNTAISLIQLFVTIVYLTILIIHVILSDRKKAYDNLQLLNTNLEKLVLERTDELLDSNKELEIQKDKVLDAFEALKKSHARLMQSEKMASLGMLTAGVAHEIKHPLNATSANMETISKTMEPFPEHMNQLRLDDDIKKHFHDMRDNIDSLVAASLVGITRTTDVIADLCAFARSDEPDMVMIDVNRNIDSTLNLLSSEITSNISIIKEYGDTPKLLCHPGKINQVIMNILVNAIHALQTRPKSHITIKTESSDDKLNITIKDNGPGMTQSVLNNLFKPFMTTKAEGMGSGLGLFISSNIIKEHRGKIKVISAIDEGTEFVITLPIQEE